VAEACLDVPRTCILAVLVVPAACQL